MLYYGVIMKKILCTVTGLLTVIGAVNWGLVGLFDLNVVSSFFSTLPAVQKAVYILIGLSGIVYGALVFADNKSF